MSRLEKMREIEKKLEDLEKSKQDLLVELRSLRELPMSDGNLPPLLGALSSDNAPSSPEQKVDLFLNLFRGRESVYPKLWENTSKKTKGYSPACNNEWAKGICGKPQVKCSACSYQAFPKLDANAVREHLQGRATIGVYALTENDECNFLAADFDGPGWSDDAKAYRNAAREIGVQAEIERSRSGNGGHAWIFFTRPIRAFLARQLGTLILARAQSNRSTMSLESYDRLFPNQDTLPKGGFGNLIALPLQYLPRSKGNTVFLKDDLTPHEDQWAHLSGLRKLSISDVEALLTAKLIENPLQLARFEDSSIASAERALDAGNEKVIAGSFPEKIEMEVGAQLTIDLRGLPASLITAFKRTATFANPKFFELQRLRFSTWNTPRFIFCGENLGDRIVLPRGVADACLGIAQKAGSAVVLINVLPNFKKIKVSFLGTLLPEQTKAVAAVGKTEIGVLVAPPGAGKTVMACALIAKRKVPTLILVHRSQLLEQWKDRLSEFLGVNRKTIGTFDGTRKKQTNLIDVGMLPSLAKLEDPAEILSAYGHIVIDECHHIPAVSFESVLKAIPAKYILGLTATPFRKDGHQAIIHMQCGPIRYEMDHVEGTLLQKNVIVRETCFRMPNDAGPQPPIHLVWEKLVEDLSRLKLIARDLRESLEAGRFPLVISERKEHLARLEAAFRDHCADLDPKSFLMIGGMSKKAREKMLQEIGDANANKRPIYILATGSFIGEGFDLPALDTLLIAMPVSFRGKLIQYAGRLHRTVEGKTEVRIYDYLDSSSALTASMFKKRLSAYRKMDYSIAMPENTANSSLFA